jgi:methylamine dehydrogenase light chain
MKNPFDLLLHRLDKSVENGARMAARLHGRRSILTKLGAVLVGTIVAPVLPFNRSYSSAQAAEAASDGDVNACDYWRYCALDGNLCNSSGGSMSSCPPGSDASKVAWVGTCHNPNDGKDYLVSYNDCCGKVEMNSATFCFSNERERPGYRMGLHNDINWCMANTNKGYHCTVAVLVGVADE